MHSHMLDVYMYIHMCVNMHTNLLDEDVQQAGVVELSACVHVCSLVRKNIPYERKYMCVNAHEPA